jgi:GntR family transcriptional regulator/MocR family aminotransferase
MGTTSPEIFVELDRSRPRGLRAQIEDGLRTAIRSGRLAPGTRLPSSRALAGDLGVTRGVVVDAYEQLAAEGYVTTVRGSGTTVNDVAEVDAAARTTTARPTARRSRAGTPDGPGVVPPGPADVAHDFRTGLPDLGLFPRAAWARATRAALATMPDADLGYHPAAGLPGLRAALSSYLGRVRGVSCTPDQVIVCNGFAHGFSLVLRALVDRGITEIGVEVPGYDDPRTQIRWAGARARAIAVDGAGLRVADLAATRVRAVVVTPAHQSPTGVVLAADRRTDLADWARTVDGIVVEDDYDAEYRYDRHPVGALQGVAPDRVVYHGTVSKSLAPGLRLGWLVAPPDLVDEILAGRKATDHMTTAIVQATFAEFLEAGDLDRHLRRTRRIYRERRDTLMDALAEWLPEVRSEGVSAGLQAFLTLPDDWDAADVVARAAARGVAVYQPVDDLMDPHQRAHSLVLGFGTLRADHIRTGIRRLAEAVRG